MAGLTSWNGFLFLGVELLGEQECLDTDLTDRKCTLPFRGLNCYPWSSWSLTSHCRAASWDQSICSHQSPAHHKNIINKPTSHKQQERDHFQTILETPKIPPIAQGHPVPLIKSNSCISMGPVRQSQPIDSSAIRSGRIQIQATPAWFQQKRHIYQN
jgi:hypothetical protein